MHLHFLPKSTHLHFLPTISLKNFYTPIQSPDKNQKVLVCLGGEYTPSAQQNLPFRGVDGNYKQRWCSNGSPIDASGNVTSSSKAVGVKVTTPTTLCDYYSPTEISQIPNITTNVKQALNFLSKDAQGFFLMYEQGDVSECVCI